MRWRGSERLVELELDNTALLCVNPGDLMRMRRFTAVGVKAIAMIVGA